MSPGQVGRPRSPDIPSKRMFCEREQKRTEHRLWSRGAGEDGSVRVWRCVQCRKEMKRVVRV